MTATSRAVVCCPWAGRPVQFSKWVPSMPSSAARRFMASTHSASLPYRASASATAASLALPTIMHFSSVSTVCRSFTSSSTWLPPMPAAAWDTVTASSGETRPASICSSVKRIVITFVTEATGRWLSAFIWNMIWPLSASISSAAAQSGCSGGTSSSGSSDTGGSASGAGVGEAAGDRSSSGASPRAAGARASSRHSMNAMVLRMKRPPFQNDLWSILCGRRAGYAGDG